MDSATPKPVSRGRALRHRGADPKVCALVRFEVRGLHADRSLIRAIARRLANEGPEAARLRQAVTDAVEGGPGAPTVGGILAALRASPLVGSGIDLTRDRVEPRDIDL